MEERTDTRDMPVAHDALRREFKDAVELVREVARGDRDRARKIAEHVLFLLQVLDLHHAGEDRLLWPKLLERLPEDVAPTIERMQRQHESIHAATDATTAAVRRWATSASTTDRDDAATSLDRLTAELIEHLGLEEEQILPLAATCMTQSEWDQLGEEGLGALPKRRLPLVFGMIMKDADPEVIRALLANVPRVPRMILPRVAPGVYARHVRDLRGI